MGARTFPWTEVISASHPRPAASPRMSFVQKLCRNLAQSFPPSSICVQWASSNVTAPDRAAAYSWRSSPKSPAIESANPGSKGLLSGMGCQAHVIDAELAGGAIEPHANDGLARLGGDGD